MRYPIAPVVHTRRGAFVLIVLNLLVMAPFVVAKLEPTRPAASVALVLLTLTPMVAAWWGLRFLGQREQVRPAPTPEMTFIFGHVVTLMVAMSGLWLVVLTNIAIASR